MVAFGKFKGKSYQRICERHTEYLQWLEEERAKKPVPYPDTARLLRFAGRPDGITRRQLKADSTKAGSS